MAAEGRRRDGGARPLIAVAALALAAADWVAVARDLRRAEALLKPLVPAVLAAIALVAERWWFGAALLLCLAGDVLLLPQVDRFRSGLAAFLLAHLAFIGGLVTQTLHPSRIGFAAGITFFVLVVGPPIVTAAPAALRAPVAIYVLVLFALNVVAVMTVSAIAMAGATFFAFSDALLAWNRFVRPLPTGRVGVMVTYHLALVLLTLTLAV